MRFLLCVIFVVISSGAVFGQPCNGAADECSNADVNQSRPAVVNVEQKPLTVCSTDPMTGWFRDGRCRTDARDRGRHVVCAQMTTEFLKFTKSRGNDLSTPIPRYGFPGLKPGDRWCLCALRWKEAFEAKKAPEVILKATHSKALEFVTKAQLDSARPKIKRHQGVSNTRASSIPAK